MQAPSFSLDVSHSYEKDSLLLPLSIKDFEEDLDAFLDFSVNSFLFSTLEELSLEFFAW